MRRVLLAWTVLAAGAAGACSASNPVAPIDQTVTALFITTMPSVWSPSVSVGQFNIYKAYVATRDGGYLDVTAQAQWTSSDAAVLRAGGSFPSGVSFTGVAPGNAEVRARYEGAEVSLPAFVVPANRSVFPSVTASSVPLLRVGDSVRMSASYRESQTAPFQTLTSGFTLETSNPTVITINGNVANGVGVGTSFLTVTYNGVTSTWYFSVHPRP
jgi:hypothetical protein